MMKDILLVCLLAIALVSCKKDDREVIPEGRELFDITLKDYFITSIAFDKKGNAWLGTLKQGLIKYDGKTAKIFDSSNSVITDAAIMDIEVDKADNVWIGSDDLLKYDGTKFTRYEARQFGFTKNAVRSIAIDANENIWFSCGSYQSGGLVKYDGSAFKTFTAANSKLPGNLVQSIVVDKSNYVWVAINDGIAEVSLARIGPDNAISVAGSKELGFTPYYFGNIVVNKENELLASINYGLSSTIAPGRPQIFKFNGSKAQILNLPDDKSVIYSTHSIFSDKNGNLWASFSGVDKECGIFNGQDWTFPKLGTSGIFVFAENPNGEMWLGTGEGLYILK
jgi:ligand-binding sensor domain-containing protein